ncbi:PREDICTED: uncharacterized protein LOC101309126 [Fragaria vesca subsp. vesca]
MEELEPSLKPRIEEAVKVVAKMGQDKLWFNEKLTQKKLDRGGLLYLNWRKEELAHSVILERKKIDLLELLLHKLRFTDNGYQKKPIEACLSAQEIKKHNLRFRMVHESKSLASEKRLLKEIKGSQKLQEEDDSFASFCTQCEADLAYVTKHLKQIGNIYTRHSRYPNWWWNIARDEQMWWLQHRMPFLISKGDTKDREGEIRDLKCRIERCGVVLLKKADKTPIADDTNANASPTLVRGKTRTSLVSKKALQEQIKLSGKKIEESRKTLLALGLGPKSCKAQRNLVGVEKEMASLRKKLPGLDQRKSEAHQCILELFTKQQD